MTPGSPRIAIAHDYLTQKGGAERVVLAMARAFPKARIYTTLYDPEGTFPEFKSLDVRVSSLNRISFFRQHHRAALPFLAPASSRMRVPGDIVIASSSGWAHGFPTTGRKIVYCYTPARWLYQPGQYLGSGRNLLQRGVLKALSPWLRRWDVRAAASADMYLAISTVVQRRIEEVYCRDSSIVPAPFTLRETDPPSGEFQLPSRGFFLVVSRLLPYKNVEAVVEAFRLTPNRRLVVVGSGPEKSRLVAIAPPNVAFLENLTDAEMSEMYSRSIGLIAASYEDFGLTPLEAAARGKPSAVLAAGGYLDTMVEEETAVFFAHPTPHEIATAIDKLVGRAWDEVSLRTRANKFSESAFVERLHAEVESLLDQGGEQNR